MDSYWSNVCLPEINVRQIETRLKIREMMKYLMMKGKIFLAGDARKRKGLSWNTFISKTTPEEDGSD